jgi:hypothetical protein
MGQYCSDLVASPPEFPYDYVNVGVAKDLHGITVKQGQAVQQQQVVEPQPVVQQEYQQPQQQQNVVQQQQPMQQQQPQEVTSHVNTTVSTSLWSFLTQQLFSLPFNSP